MEKDKKADKRTSFFKSKFFYLLIATLVLFIFVRSRSKNNNDVFTIQKGDVKEELILSGSIEADEHAELSFQSSGELSWVGVKEGETVKKGQSLAKLDTTSLKASLDSADATLRSKASTLDRVYDDLKDKSGNESYTEIETRTSAETAKDSAVFNYIIADQNIKNAVLYAPFSGIVSFVAHPFSGVNVLYSEKQIEVVNPETIYFEVNADQTEVLNLKEGQKATIVLDAVDQELEATIDFISLTPTSQDVGTTYKVKLKIISTFDVNQLRVGMSGDAKFVIKESNNTLWIPPKYVNTDDDGKKYVNLSSKNNKVEVEVGVEGDERFEIKGDIKEGQKVYD